MSVRRSCRSHNLRAAESRASCDPTRRKPSVSVIEAVTPRLVGVGETLDLSFDLRWLLLINRVIAVRRCSTSSLPQFGQTTGHSSYCSGIFEMTAAMLQENTKIGGNASE